MKDIDSLFNKSIYWRSAGQKQGGRGSEFYAYVDGERWNLCMNDFPEEPLFTLTIGERSIDFDDRPRTWVLPERSKEDGTE